MKKKMYSTILGAAAFSALMGASLVLAQNLPTQNQPAQTAQQAAPQNNQTGNSNLQDDSTGMDMPKMMDCCKKMQGQMKDMKMTDCPMMKGSGNSGEKPVTDN